MWQLASTHGSPMVAPTYWPYVVTTHRQSKQNHTIRGHNLTVTFQKGLSWLIYGRSSALWNCLILWNLCDIASYPKGRLNSSILVTMRLGHSSVSQHWHQNLRCKDHLHWGSAEGLLQAAPDGDLTANPQFWAVIHNRPHRGSNRRHLQLSDQF